MSGGVQTNKKFFNLNEILKNNFNSKTVVRSECIEDHFLVLLKLTVQ